MSDIINKAVETLNQKMAGSDFDGSALFDIEGEGKVYMDSNGAEAADKDADCTLSAEPETFQQIMNGDLDPTAAFMSGKLKIDGDMGTAMKLAQVL